MKITPPAIPRVTSSSSGGDTSGPAGNQTVVGIQGTPVCATAPTTGEVLTFDGSEWCPATTSAGTLVSISDGITTIADVSDLTVPPYSLSGTTPNADIAWDRLDTVGTSGASQTVDIADGDVHDITLTAPCTITLAGATSGRSSTLVVVLRGAFATTWPGSVTWLHSVQPNATDTLQIVTLWTFDGGSTWGATLVGAGAASPLTTKGDLWGYDTSEARVPVGTNGQVLTADSTDTQGVSYQDASSLIALRHYHVDNDLFSGDGSQVAFTLSAGAVDSTAVSVFVAGTRSQDWTLSGALLDTLIFGTAPASGALNIAVDIVAAV